MRLRVCEGPVLLPGRVMPLLAVVDLVCIPRPLAVSFPYLGRRYRPGRDTGTRVLAPRPHVIGQLGRRR